MSNHQPLRMPPRALSLDALRGFAILTMILSGVIPYGVLPAWMYHAQIPPPDHTLNPELPGLTWVDLVFPLFLFALGTAIPLALGKRIKQQVSYGAIVWHILERTLLLAFFAVFLQHVRPHIIDPDLSARAWLLALAGFVIMFAVFSRFPAWIPKRGQYAVKIAGWLAAVAMLIYLRYPDGQGFSLQRSDIIIVVLTNAYCFASLLWLISRQSHYIRIAVMGLLVAARLSHGAEGWVQWLWEASPIPFIYKFSYLQYLLIVIPGTIAGDYFVQWRDRLKLKNRDIQYTSRHAPALIALLLLIVIETLLTLQARWLLINLFLTLLLLIAVHWLLRGSDHPDGRLLSVLFQYGAYLLVLGLFLEPFEGGIKKDHATLSYYFVTAGLSFIILMIFTILLDFHNIKTWLLRLLVDNGQNPMIAYVGFANVVWPILGLSTLDGLLREWTVSPWLGFVRGCAYTLLTAVMVSFFTRKRFFWRT